MVNDGAMKPERAESWVRGETVVVARTVAVRLENPEYRLWGWELMGLRLAGPELPVPVGLWELAQPCCTHIRPADL